MPHVDDEAIHAELKARVQTLRRQLEAIETTGEPNPTTAPTRQQQAAHEHVVEEEAFTSTSYDQGAKFGGNVEFEIRSRTGTRIDFLSRFPSEKEVLLVAGTRLKVVSKTYDATTNRWHIVMEETP